MRIFSVLFLIALTVLVFAAVEWLRRVQLPRLMAERYLLGIPDGKGYWSWPWQRKLEKLTEGSEIIICENCHVSGYVKTPCYRCGHIIGNPVWRDGAWSYQ